MAKINTQWKTVHSGKEDTFKGDRNEAEKITERVCYFMLCYFVKNTNKKH